MSSPVQSEVSGVHRLCEYTKLSQKLAIQPKRIQILTWTPRVQFRIVTQDDRAWYAPPYPEFYDDLSYEDIVSQACQKEDNRERYRRDWPGFGQALSETQLAWLNVHVQERHHDKYGRQQKFGLSKVVLRRWHVTNISAVDMLRDDIARNKSIMLNGYSFNGPQLEPLGMKSELSRTISMIEKALKKVDCILASQKRFMKCLRILEDGCWNVCWETEITLKSLRAKLDGPEWQQVGKWELLVALLFVVTKLENTIEIFQTHLSRKPDMTDSLSEMTLGQMLSLGARLPV